MSDVRATSRLWLGTAAFGAWANADHDSCARIIHRALDLGIDGVDTADSYSGGEAEVVVGKALLGRRDQVLLASKFGYWNDGTGATIVDRRAIVGCAEASLRRLQTDHLDLYQVHRFSPATELDDIVAAFDELVRSGKVLAVGTSMFPPAALVLAQWSAARAGAAPFVAEQAPYSMLVREIERGVTSTCRRLDMAVIGFAPVNGGWLTGKYRGGAPDGSRAQNWPVRPERFDFGRPEIVRKLEVVDALASVASDVGCSQTQLAVAFALANPNVAASIVGPRTEDQLDELVGALDVELPPEVLDAIDALVPPGTTVDPEDILGYMDTDVRDPALRRRS